MGSLASTTGSRSQPFNRGRRFAKEILAGEIYA